MDLRKDVTLLLAHPEVNDQQFDTFCEWLSKDGYKQIITQAEQIRSILNEKRDSASNRNEQVASRQRSLDTIKQPEVEAITRLLLTEAHLTKGVALRELIRRLRYEDRLPDRVSFEKALLRLMDALGPSLVLSAATDIRNRRVHYGYAQNDWPLKGGLSETSEQTD